jgi:hypothetical protein
MESVSAELLGIRTNHLSVPGRHPTLNALIKSAHLAHLISGKGVEEYLWKMQ